MRPYAQYINGSSWFGVTVVDINPQIAKDMNLPSKGVLVNEVIQRSPAAECGIKVGDIILRYNGREVLDRNFLPSMVAMTADGQRVPVTVWSDGSEKVIVVTIGRQADSGLEHARERRIREMFASLPHEDKRLPYVWFGLCALVKNGLFRHLVPYEDHQIETMKQTIASTSDLLRHLIGEIALEEERQGSIIPDNDVEAMLLEKIGVIKKAFKEAGGNCSNDDVLQHYAMAIWDKLPRDSDANPLLYNTVEEELGRRRWTSGKEISFRDVLYIACIKVAEEVAASKLNIESMRDDELRDRVKAKINDAIKDLRPINRFTNRADEMAQYYNKSFTSRAWH